MIMKQPDVSRKVKASSLHTFAAVPCSIRALITCDHYINVTFISVPGLCFFSIFSRYSTVLKMHVDIGSLENILINLDIPSKDEEKKVINA